MATIKPFKAIRPRKEYVEQIVSLPYDVFTEKEAREIVNNNPLSFLKIVRPETVFPEGTDMYGDIVYEKAAQMLQEYIDQDIMLTEDSECYYIYRQQLKDRTQTGIVGCFAADDYMDNIIKRHENTRHDKELDRTRHIDICSANTGQVFLAFEKNNGLDLLIDKIETEEPIYDFCTSDNVRQIIWKVDQPEDIEMITYAFSRMDSLYIADGHHRASGAAAVCQKKRKADPAYTGNEEYNFFMAVAFQKDQLLIYPYNRVVKNLNGYTDEEFLDRIVEQGFLLEHVSDRFIETEKRRGAYKIRFKGEIAMYLSGNWYRLIAPLEMLRDDPVGSLDVSLLQNNILAPVLGITDPRSNENIEFVGGIKGFREIEKRCNDDMRVGFSLYPTSMEELFRVTDEGSIMPPKSTWFEPKLQSGLFIHRI